MRSRQEIQRSLLPAIIGLLLGAVAPLGAQPSGGPYGPVQQTYEVPRAPHVYYVAPDGGRRAGQHADPADYAGVSDRTRRHG